MFITQDALRELFNRYDDLTTGLRVFLVQYFMDDHGVIGASGLEDPKVIYADGVAYKTRIIVEEP